MRRSLFLAVKKRDQLTSPCDERFFPAGWEKEELRSGKTELGMEGRRVSRIRYKEEGLAAGYA